MDEPGCLVVSTDASGNDGVGGYCFLGSGEDRAAMTAWLVSEAWPPEAREALRRGVATAATRA
eukprot:6198381-Pleurochrysis_carterae.AAC.2